MTKFYNELEQTVMLIAIDSTTPEGKALISEIDGRFLRAEWVDQAHYAPMVLLEKAEAKLRRIEQVAIHTTQGNCIIPSSLILGGES
jgi:hypothetical protein